MSVSTRHPSYQNRQQSWQQMADCHAGEAVVKAAGVRYLPATEGMILDGMTDPTQPGYRFYCAYAARALFPDFVKQGIEAMVGIMHREPARIELPEKMKPLLESCTVDGESLHSVLRKLNDWQLLYGRCGILIEAPTGPDTLPYLALYAAPRIVNWDDGPRSAGKQRLEFVTLDESDYERTGAFQWEHVEKYRVCAMSNSAARIGESNQAEPTDTGEYVVTVADADAEDLSAAEWVTPSIRGKTLGFIPFIFVNTKDLVSEPDDPPLLGLSNICLAIYRGEADYRLCLHMQGQETLVISGTDTLDPNTRLGVGARLCLPREGKAEFVGISAEGLTAMKEALDSDKQAAAELTSRLFESTGSAYQSGEALRIRVSSKTATLRTVVHTGAAALKQALEIIADWIGADKSKIVVEPNDDFADTAAASRTALELVQAKTMGFPISKKSLHRYAMQQGLTILSYDEEMSEIEDEPPTIDASMQGIGGAAGGVLGTSTGGARVKRGVEDSGDSE